MSGDREMWAAIRLGLIGIQRGLGAIIKAIERRWECGDERRAA